MKRPAAASSTRDKRRKQQVPFPDKLPVSTLCGFLGAGKTTLLKHILECKHSEDADFKCAVIVNDVAELNIDKNLIDQSALVQSDDVIALQNGCVCCTLQNDLVTQITDMAKKRAFHYMIIEASGVSEPSQIAKVFADCEEDHDHSDEHEHMDVLSDVAKLDTCVTIVDSADFFNKFEMIRKGPEQENFPQLLAEQIEYANVIVLNKTDLVSKAQLAKVIDQLRILNTSAKILTSQKSKIDVMEVVNTGLYKVDDFAGFHINDEEEEEEELYICCKAKIAGGELRCCELLACCNLKIQAGEVPCCSSGSKRTHDSGKSKVTLAQSRASKPYQLGKSQTPRHASRFGITSFIYHARRPFHPERFHKDFVEKYFVNNDKDEDTDDAEKTNTKKGPGRRGSKSDEQKKKDKQREAAIRKQQNEANVKQKLRTQDMGDLLRSKGHMWLANRHELAGMMSQAGSVIQIEFPGKWSVLNSKAWEGTEKEMATIRKNWVAPWGDRRQELVFIGKDLKHEAIQEILDGCLLTDKEFNMGVDAWRATMGCVLLEYAMEADDSEDEDHE